METKERLYYYGGMLADIGVAFGKTGNKLMYEQLISIANALYVIGDEVVEKELNIKKRYREAQTNILKSLLNEDGV